MNTHKSTGFNSEPVILFDGVCNLCDGFVNFVLDRDRKQHLYFASQQSAAGQEILRGLGISSQPETIIFVSRGRYYAHSTAVLMIFRHLNGLWSLLYYFKFIPPFIRDYIYRWVARNRYRWFGQRTTCRMPSPELKKRFLD
ncbi:MAG: thiol-disulfide oxidoreductase DCC family protein [Cyanobacteria bacterium P01_D01_bin.71]